MLPRADTKVNYREYVMKRVIVFEDHEAKRIELVRQLKQKLRSTATVSIIDGSGPPMPDRTYESQLEEMMREEVSKGTLVVCDKDLSGMTPRFIGLSGSTVASTADRLGFPLCLYARGETHLEGEALLKSIAPWEKKRIILEFTTENDLACECACIFKGFAQIETAYNRLPAEDRSTPAKALSKILKKPNVEDRIALYGSGEQGFLEDIMPFVKPDSADTAKELNRRMPRILGNWLYTSIMRFPGILVNKVAAASYLNIARTTFLKPEVQKVFLKAKYKGPFTDLKDLWWRHELDSILSQKKCKDGMELAKQRGLRVGPCKDSQTGKHAGYYCMVTREPVSAENSRGGISWFPAGADLSRIRTDKFDELAPWVGLY
jgi:hypothetical protein